MIKQLYIPLLLAFLPGCVAHSPRPSSTITHPPLHRLLVLGQQGINNLSVIQLFKDKVKDDPFFGNVFDDLATDDYNRMAAMLNQHLLGFFKQAGGSFSMNPKKSDRCCLSLVLVEYEIFIDTLSSQRAGSVGYASYSSDSIHGTWLRQMDSLGSNCNQLDSLSIRSNQFSVKEITESYSVNEGKGCLMNCAVLYHYNLKVMDKENRVVLDKDCTVHFKSKIILPDKVQ